MKIKYGERTIEVDPRRVTIASGRPGFARAVIDGKTVEFGWARRDNGFWITIDGVSFPMEVIDDRVTLATRSARGGARQTEVRAPLPGLVRAILVKPGAKVRRGDSLMTLDAMKMENEIQSPAAGQVRKIHVGVGAPVNKDAVLVTLA